MNASEKRRKELVERTRRIYSNRREPPSVHPRFGSVYGRLYERDEESSEAGTFGVRLFLCLLLFIGFVTMDKQDYQVFQMDSKEIVQEINTDLDVREVWKNL